MENNKATGATLPCTLDEFKHRAASFIKACPTLDADQLDNGWKALGLSFIGLPNDKLTETMARPVLDYAAGYYVKRDQELFFAQLA